MRIRAVVFRVFLLLQCTRVFAQVHQVSYTCHKPINDGDEFILELRLKPSGDTAVTGLQSVVKNTYVLTDPVCSATLTDGTYVLSKSIDVEDSDCGVTKVDSTASTYSLLFKALGTIQYHEVKCDTTKLLGRVTSTSEFETTPVRSNFIHRSNPYDVKFQVVEADGSYVPTSNVYEGQDIKLRLIYKQAVEYDAQNLGYIFHTGTAGRSGDTELILQIVTPGLGTKVKIEGQLSGKTFIYYAKVKRDNAVEIILPDEYYGNGNGAARYRWITDKRAIKITAIHDRIGVKVISRGSMLERSFIAIPDSAVSFNGKYEYSVTNVDNIDVQVVVIPFSANTMTVEFNEFPAASRGVTIDGVAVTGSSVDLPLTEFELFVLRCNNNQDCHNIDFISDDPFVVLVSRQTGQGSSNEDMATMLSPKHINSKRYVLFYPTGLGNSYRFVDPVNDQPINFATPGNDVTRNGDYWRRKFSDYNGVNAVAFEILSAKPIAVYGIFPLDGEEDKGDDRSTFTLPSISQWGVRLYFYATEGRKYDLYFVSYKNDMANIQLKLGTITTSFAGATLGDVPGFSNNLVEVPRVSDESSLPARFEYFVLSDFEVMDSNAYAIKSGLVEWRAGTNHRPFMLVIIEKTSDGKLRQAYSSLGVRFPTTNPCTTTPSDHTFSSGFGASFETKPGDLIDSDCDGLVDEEINNGIDDDGDGLVDEDLALGEIYERGIEVDTMFFDVVGTFDSSKKVEVITDGCNNDDKFYSDIGTFSLNSDLSSLFDDYWVLDSKTFNAFKITSESEVHFKVEYDVCFDGDLTTVCAKCTPPPDIFRRSLEQKEEPAGKAFAHLKLHRNFSTDNKDEILGQKTEMEKDATMFDNPCLYSVEFWTRVGGLVVIILMEASMIAGMLAYKHRVINSLQ